MVEVAARMDRPAAPASAGEVFCAFLKLGLTSFGGPIAHIGYFRAAFVARRAWLSDSAFADLVALAQFLPGPASSQVGFAIGLSRAGWRGGLAAWAGFTLPSAALMLAFAFGAARLGDLWWGAGLLHGLQLTAVAVVAQAVLGMARTLAPDPPRAAIAVATLALLSVISGALVQLAALIAGGLLGLAFCGREIAAPSDEFAFSLSRRAGLVALAALFVLLALSFLPFGQGLAPLAAAFYRSGALVFGGGHVVLPLLRDAVVAPGWVSDHDFLSGYGAAQALPGPLFTVSAYLGAIANVSTGGSAGPMGALIALVAIFAPGLLALTGALPFWGALRRQPRAQAAMRGVNAAVVGLLAAALYNPLWTSAVIDARDFALVAVAFTLLVAWRAPPLAVVVFAALAGIALAA